MPASVKIEFHYKAFNQLRKDPKVQAALLNAGLAMAEAAGGLDDIGVQPSVGKARARVTVFTATPKAMAAEATNKTLTSSLDAGRSACRP